MFVTHHREKLIQAIVYFALNTDACGKIKLFKLLYLLDFEHFRQTGRSVTGMEYRAWERGPVPSSLVQEWDDLEPDLAAAVSIEPERIVDHMRETVVARTEFDPSHFSKRELRLLKHLSDQYRDTFSAEMIDVTHAENGAWEKVWNHGRGSFQRIDYDLALEESAHRRVILDAAREYESAAAQVGHR